MKPLKRGRCGSNAYSAESAKAPQIQEGQALSGLFDELPFGTANLGEVRG